jgi:hypothetical protein
VTLARALAASTLALGLAACAVALPPPEANLDSIQSIRGANLPSLGVATFTAAPGMPARTISVRADSMDAPGGRTFADYLQATLEAQLKGAGKFDSAAGAVIGGVLDQSHLDSAMSGASAYLGATFTVRRGGQEVYRKALKVEDRWPGAFMGVTAIPDAMNHYTALYSKLVQALLDDPAFRTAVRG